MRFLTIYKTAETDVPPTREEKEEAIAWTKRFLACTGDGESEIRQIAEVDDFGDALTPELREQEERLRARRGQRDA